MTPEELSGGLNYINRVLNEYTKEDDRSAATLVTAELDAHLLKLLTENLLPHVDYVSSPLLGRGEPLEAFGARIELAYRLGLIPLEFHHDLHLIRKIRNEFAHGRAGISFREGKVEKLASKLLVGRRALEKMNIPKIASEKIFHSRNLFSMTATVLLPQIFILTARVKRV